MFRWHGSFLMILSGPHPIIYWTIANCGVKHHSTYLVSVNITGKCNQTDQTYISGRTSVVVGCVFSSYPSRSLTITCQRGDTLMSTSSRIFYKTGRESLLFSVQLKFTPILRRDRGRQDERRGANPPPLLSTSCLLTQ